MRVAICADKGAPGVTTLAMALALVWPGPRLLLEADPSGGDISFRARTSDGQLLAQEPSVQTLAIASRHVRPGVDLTGYAQTTSLGVPVIAGPERSHDWDPIANLWFEIAELIVHWRGTVIADLGRLHPGHRGLPVAEASDVILVLAKPDPGSLFHARELVGDLTREDDGTPVGVVLRVGRKDRDLRSVFQANRSLRRPVPIVGAIADDPAGVDALLLGAGTTFLRRTALIRSATDLVTRIHRTWPSTSPHAVPSKLLARRARGLRDVVERRIAGHRS